MRSLYAPGSPAPQCPTSDETRHHLRRFVAPDELGPLHLPADPARINPSHLPALAHVGSDVEFLTVPVRVVAPVELGVCVDCEPFGDGAMPVADSVATVVAVDAYGFVYSSPVCAVHVEPLARWHARRECVVRVDVPATGGVRWFERSERETFYAVSDSLSGVAVVRGMGDVWMVVDVDHTGFASSRPLAVVGLRDGESYDDARVRAEVLAQAVASQRARDLAVEADTDAVTVALPVVAMSEAA